jgi:hypothetical protein
MSGDNSVPRASLSIDRNVDTEEDNVIEDDFPGSLRKQILELVKAAPNHTIRPSTLTQSLGLSINEANAELCGLLQAVGEGSSFYFETLGSTKSMVFVFPPDFERKALREQLKTDWTFTLSAIGEVLYKAIKVLTAFGLILSIVIVSIAGLFALLAAFVALSRAGGGDSHRTRTHLTRQMHNLFLTVRQLLWCYAMFGPVGDSEQDPFFREAAYDTWLVLSLCCGNPGSIFFWWRASHLRQRRQRQRYARGWGGTRGPNGYDNVGSDLEGVSLVRRNHWTGEEERIPIPSASGEHRGLLSSLVEFLFGPTLPPRPSEADKWRLRSAVIVEKASNSRRNTRSISLQELAPYADSPPSSLEESFQVIREGLAVVAYFNGVPSHTSSTDNKQSTHVDTEGDSTALFDFPELIAEGHDKGRYDDPNFWEQAHNVSEDNHRWKGFFYCDEASEGSSTSSQAASRSAIPKFLYESPTSFTTLSRNHFTHCTMIALLNFIGVLWFAQSVEPGGILYDYLNVTFGNFLRHGLIPVLWFYARVYLLTPFGRMVYLLIWNELCQQRNQKRSHLAMQLNQ